MYRRAPAFLLSLAACAATTPRYQLRLPERHTLLENGMKVIILPDPTTDLVEIDVRYEVGANEDLPGKAGLAHLVEHLMFDQRQAGPDKPPLGAILRKKSIYFNAFTVWDYTHYQTVARGEELEDVVALEAARLATGCQTISQEEFDKEREVVRNEIRQRTGTPEAQVESLILADVFPEGHPYRHPVGGDDEQLARITRADACQFMQAYYVPERAIMVIAGNVSEARAAPIIDRWLAALPARKPAPRVAVPPVRLSHKTFTHEADVDEPLVYMAWALPQPYTDDDIAAEFGTGAVTGMTGSFGAMYEFASGIAPDRLGGERAPVFAVRVALRDTDKIDDAIDFLGKSARAAHRAFTGGDSEEWEKLRRREIGSLTLGMQELGTRAVAFADFAQFDPSGRYLAGQIRRLKAIDPDRIPGAVERILDPDHAVVVVVKPRRNGAGRYQRAAARFGGASQGPTSEEFPVDPAEAHTPIPVPDPPTPLGQARRFSLENGMKVVLLPIDTSLPVVSEHLVFRAGTVHEPADEAGLADVVAGRLRGSDDVLAEVGIEWDGSATPDSTVFEAQGLNIYLEPVIKGMERLIRTGDYSQTGLERWHDLFGLQMKRRQVRGRYAFARALAEAVYGADHPYSRAGLPTVASVGRIGRDDAYSWKSKHYSASNATLILTGNFDAAQAERIIRDTFGAWSSGDADKNVAPPARPPGGAYVGVQGEDAPTLQVAIAYRGPGGLDDDEASQRVLVAMLNKRLNDVREKLAATYGVYARFERRVAGGSYQMGGAIDAERGGEALSAMRALIDSLRGEAGFDEDFVRARRLVLQELLARAGDSSTLGQVLTGIALYGAPAGHHDQLIKDVAALTPEKVRARMAKDLPAANEVIVLLGGKAAVERAFREAGIANVKVVAVDKD